MMKFIVALLCLFFCGSVSEAFTLDIPESRLVLSTIHRRSSLSFSANPFSSPPSPLSTETTTIPLVEESSIKFLGHGPKALVGPGVLLLAPPEEYHHLYRRAALFVYAMGTTPSGDVVIRAVLLDHSTPFTMGEMSPDIHGTLAHSLLWKGGATGDESVMLLHNHNGIGMMIGDDEEVGIHQGGLQQAIDLLENSSEDDDNEKYAFKFFFNYCEFTLEELQGMFRNVPANGQGWMSARVPPEVVLSQTWEKGDCWKFVRNICRKQQQQQQLEGHGGVEIVL
mmetsp:Transcript_19447/g.45256  ORF Transcript_19447/g.45256 Transcript_19447/m.45256 type:complete len:281 (-) Transcript_19447:41-883(-)|eukprot:CAMPEP_0116869174 /NCGR_PEP_ID=MMETSP0418-20121206/27614_1 /TAXON_ID=1158023 /ORGANISM="Astrosyne radiata, Strain 13vi08-1A" /LENGTH=280 /DNA_ID=CAMNT_0004505243 /DNA_START=88 /DNA_END=930 /DNA_ORIENTATION=+